MYRGTKKGSSKSLDSYRFRAWWACEGVSAQSWWSLSYRRVRMSMHHVKFMFVYEWI